MQSFSPHCASLSWTPLDQVHLVPWSLPARLERGEENEGDDATPEKLPLTHPLPRTPSLSVSPLLPAQPGSSRLLLHPSSYLFLISVSPSPSSAAVQGRGWGNLEKAAVGAAAEEPGG